MKYEVGAPKWTLPEDTVGGVLTGMTRRKVIARVNENLASADSSWASLVNDNWSTLIDHDQMQELADSIFDEFVTTKTRGLGLGLSISKRIVEQLDGTIAVASEVGRGTAFTLRFPARDDRAAQAAAS